MPEEQPSHIDDTTPNAMRDAPDEVPTAPRTLFEQWVDSPWFWMALMLALSIQLPFVPVPNRVVAIIGALALVIFWSVAVVQFAVLATRRPKSLPQILGWLGLSLATWAAVEFVLAPGIMLLVANFAPAPKTPQPANSVQLATFLAVRAMQDLALLNAAVAGGSLVARLVTAPNMVGPICGIIALIDVWGVLFGGIVSQLLEKAPQVAKKAMAAAPAIGAATHSQYIIPQPAIGAGDYLFLGLLFAALHAHHMNWKGARALTMPLVIVALIAITMGVPALPGLVFIGLGTALPNWRYFQFTREEKFALLYASIFVVILTIGLYFGFTSLLPDKPPVGSA